MGKKIIKKIYGGLVPTQKDDRDIKFGAIFKLPKLETIPGDFIVAEPLAIKDQGDNDFCTGHGGTYASEAQEGIELSPDRQYAKACKLRNDFKEWGMDLRTAMKSLQGGSLPMSEVPNGFEYNGTNRDFLANWKNWEDADPDIETIEEPYKKDTYGLITGPYDLFDNIRATLWLFRNEKRYAITGAVWKHAWTAAEGGIIPQKEVGGQGFGHCFVFIGTKVIGEELYLVALLSNGTDIGDNGRFYFSREVVNRELVYGTYTLKDIRPEVAKQLVEMKEPLRFAWLAKIIVAIRKLFT